MSALSGFKHCAGLASAILVFGLVGPGGLTAAESTSLPPRLPLEAFFAKPNLSQPRLSPDGTKIAFLFAYEGKLALGLFARATGEGHMVVHFVDDSIRGFFWKGNDRLVFFGDAKGNESFFIGSTDLAGKKIKRLAESQIVKNSLNGTIAGIIDELPGDPDLIALRAFFAEGKLTDVTFINGQPEVATVSVRTKARSTLFTFNGSEDYGVFLTDNGGVLRMASREQNHQNVWLHRANNKGRFEELARFPIHGYAEQWEPFHFAGDNQSIYLLSREEDDRGALYAYNPATKQRGPVLFTPPEGEIVELITSRDRTKLYGVAYESDRLHHHWFEPRWAALQERIENTFPGMEVRLISTSTDEQVHLAYVSSDRDPGTYFVLDLKIGALQPFKRRRDIDPKHMRPMEPIHYTARDGLEIHGYLTRPAGSEGRRVPLIINPHGGPFGVRDSWEFNSEVQFLANRGYAVLQVNYRGSGGYGRDFLDRGRQQWGRAMQDDLTDAVKWAIAQGITDPERIGIYGASYGGYAALAGATLTPELYRCAINYVGVTDLEIAFKPRGGDADLTRADYSYQQAWVGPDKAYRDATSPINFIERIRIPTLHAYGLNDPRVEIEHWYRLEAALKKFGKTYVGYIEREQGHGFGGEKESLKFYAEMEKFLSLYLPVDAPTKN